MNEKSQNTESTNALSDYLEKIIEESYAEISESKIFGRLLICNFGAIKYLDIKLKKKNIIIGDNNTGKSTVAKTLSILLDVTLINKSELEIRKKFRDAEIDFFSNGTLIFLISLVNTYIISSGVLYIRSSLGKITKLEDATKKSDLHYKVESVLSLYPDKKSINSEIFEELQEKNEELKEINLLINQIKPIYIPADRNLISAISNSLFFLANIDTPLDKTLTAFGANYEVARKHLGSLKSSIFNVEYRYESNEDRIYLTDEKYIKLSEASSSIQVTIPLSIVLEYYGKTNTATVLVEEPELNLFPENQKKITNYLAKFCDDGRTTLMLITTHSPYILSAFNNLIQAGTLAQEKPELIEEINKIIPKESWINFEDVSAYVLENGTARSILDEEWKGIVAEEIDKTSQIIGDEYERLLELKYKDEA